MCPHPTFNLADVPGFIIVRPIYRTVRMVTYLRGPSEGFSLSIQDAAVYLARDHAELVANQFPGSIVLEIREALTRSRREVA